MKKEELQKTDINSETLNEVKEKKSDKKQDIKNLKKDVEKQNSLLNYLSDFEKSPLFERKSIKSWEILFDEWAIDNNLYIIKSWILSVEKYTSTDRIGTKQLAILKTWDFLWEAGLDKNNLKKENLIKALENTEVLAIDGKNDLKKFIEESPSLWYEILKHIITQTNKRLQEANKLITNNYEIEKEINNLKTIDQKSIFWLIDKSQKIVWVDYILYFEKHQIMENFLILKYDSRQPNKMQDKIFEKTWNFLDLDELYKECEIKKEDNVVISKLSIWEEIFWYLVFVREKNWFSWSDKKIFSSFSNSLVWVIKKLFTDKEIRDKIYINEMKNRD